MGYPRKDAIKIDVTLRPDQISWSRVVSLYVSRSKLPTAQAKKRVREFFGQVSRMLEPQWLRTPELSKEYNQIVLCICEVHGADSVTVVLSKSFGLGVKILISQSLRFSPAFSADQQEGESGSCEAQMTVSVLGREVSLKSLSSLVLFRLLAVGFLVFLYVALVGLLLYGLSAFAVLVIMPVEGIRVVTTNGTIGLALLLFLVGVAGLGGRVIRDILKRVR